MCWTKDPFSSSDKGLEIIVVDLMVSLDVEKVENTRQELLSRFGA